MSIQDILSRARALLQGEPLRAIVYGAALVIWLVVGIASALGYERFPDISLDEALVQATAAAAFLTELGRRFVYSPATVSELVSEE